MAIPDSTKKLQRERILQGQCPLCGQEAAPYRLCYDHRFRNRMDRALKRGKALGALDTIGSGRGKLWKPGPNPHNPEWDKWQTPIHLDESDGRGRPRLRGIPVDVERTLLAVINFIDRPCTTEEILAAWGKLRDRRSAPLANDLGRIIKSADRRQRRLAKAAKVAHGNALQ